MHTVKPLLCSPSPRDISEVYTALKQTRFPRLYAKYFPERIAYNRMRQWFLDHEEYTHMVICPDDLIVEKKHLLKLIKTLEKKDYPLLSGVCNVDNVDNKNYLNITENLPHPQRMVPKRNQIGWRWYAWIHKDTKFRPTIQSFPFSGFAAMFIRRDVVKRYRFIDDSKFNGTPGLITGAIDVMFANTCAVEKIPQMVDTSVRMDHLKGRDRFFDITLGEGELRFYFPGSDSYTIEYKEGSKNRREWQLTGGEVVEGQIENESDNITPKS